MKITSRICLILLCFGVSALAADQSVVLKAARMFDGKSNALVQNAVVVVQGDKIVDAGANVAVPQGAQVIDLGDVTLSPGFMDAHSHVTLNYFGGDFSSLRLRELDTNVSEHAIEAVNYARATL